MSIPAAFIGVILIWSTTPLAIQWSGDEVGFLFGICARMLLSTVLCLGLLMVLRQRLPLHAWRAYVAAGLGIYGSMMCVYWSAQYVTSGLISVLYGLTPLITSVLALVMLGERSLGRNQLVGMLFGVVGLWVIFADNIAQQPIMGIGLAVLLLAVVLHALSSVWVKREAAEVSPLVLTSSGLVVAAPLYLLTWFGTGQSLPSEVPLRTLAAIGYLGIFGSVIGFVLYYYMLRHISPSKAALTTLVTPVLALLLGHWLNAETVAPLVWGGTAMILLGLAMHQWGGLGNRLR